MTDLNLEMVKADGWDLEHVPKKFITPEICLAAVQRHGNALAHVPEEFITPEICLAAVTNSGFALFYVPWKLQTTEMCLIALKEGEDIKGAIFYYMSPECITPGMYVVFVNKRGANLKIVPNEFKTPEVCLAAIRQNPDAEQYSPYSVLELMSLI